LRTHPVVVIVAVVVIPTTIAVTDATGTIVIRSTVMVVRMLFVVGIFTIRTTAISISISIVTIAFVVIGRSTCSC